MTLRANHALAIAALHFRERRERGPGRRGWFFGLEHARLLERGFVQIGKFIGVDRAGAAMLSSNSLHADAFPVFAFFDQLPGDFSKVGRAQLPLPTRFAIVSRP